MIDPTIIPISMLLTGCITVAARSYAIRKRDSVLVYESALVSALSGLVGMGVLSLGSLLILGPNLLTNMWVTVDLYIGIVLFSGLIAYDTQAAIKAYNDGGPSEIACATSIYLDIMNIMLRIMSMMTDEKSSSTHTDQNMVIQHKINKDENAISVTEPVQNTINIMDTQSTETIKAETTDTVTTVIETASAVAEAIADTALTVVETVAETAVETASAIVDAVSKE